jgi:hypothetical protein
MLLAKESLMSFRKAPEMEAFHAGLCGPTLYYSLQNLYLLTEFSSWFQVRQAVITSHLDSDYLKLKRIELSSKPWKTRLRSCSIMGLSIQRALLLVYPKQEHIEIDLWRSFLSWPSA